MATASPALPISVPAAQGSRFRRLLHWIVLLLFVYLALAYMLLPYLWRRHMANHPGLSDDTPRVTVTGNKIPGDPLNLGLVGTKSEIVRAMQAAGWKPADATTLASSLKIARTSVFRNSYETAPMSNLFVYGRKQDLAFQYPVGKDPRQRHHVRFWSSPNVDDDDRPVWLGAATFDKSVGIATTTLQVTHHIDGDVDTERDKLLEDLQRAGVLADLYWIDDFHEARQGRNGGGDLYRTDGRMGIGIVGSSED
jgi:LssY-like putative type I secretion system component LssY